MKERTCTWETIRILSLKPRPRCDPPKWKVKIAKNAPMFAGQTMYLCDYHRKNLALRFVKVEKL